MLIPSALKMRPAYKTVQMRMSDPAVYLLLATGSAAVRAASL